MHPKPKKPNPPPIVSDPTMQEPLLPVTCRCGRTIFVERRDVTETHRCPSCASRFTIVSQLDENGEAVATPKYEEAKPAKPPVPAPQYPAPPPARPSPPPAPVPPPPKPAPPPAPAAAKPATAEERMRLSEVLPPNGAIREFLIVVNDESCADTPLQAAAMKAIVKYGPKSIPFLTANLMAGPMHAHEATLVCLREINDAAAVPGLVEYARSLRGVGQDELKTQAEELAVHLVKQGR